MTNRNQKGQFKPKEEPSSFPIAFFVAVAIVTFLTSTYAVFTGGSDIEEIKSKLQKIENNYQTFSMVSSQIMTLRCDYKTRYTGDSYLTYYRGDVRVGGAYVMIKDASNGYILTQQPLPETNPFSYDKYQVSLDFIIPSSTDRKKISVEFKAFGDKMEMTLDNCFLGTKFGEVKRIEVK